MVWFRHGLIFNVSRQFGWNLSHAQVPTAHRLNDNLIRVFYSSRDDTNRSRISFFDVSASNPMDVKYVHNSPICDLGRAGAFDDCGMMPTSVVSVGNKTLLYYTGWSERVLVPYHNSIGVLSIDPCGTAARIGEGPVFGATIFEPFFVATAEVKYHANRFVAWYAACVGWEEIDGKMDPSYNIRFATSKDGLIWERNGDVAIGFADEREKGVVSASVLNEAHAAEMWFCYRRNGNFREDPSAAYKIGYARYSDNKGWERCDHYGGLLPLGSGWESQMVCYPSVIEVNGKRFMFYNGNGFGASGIGLCEWV